MPISALNCLGNRFELTNVVGLVKLRVSNLGGVLDVGQSLGCLLDEKSGCDPLSFAYPNVTNDHGILVRRTVLRTVGSLGAFFYRKALGLVTLRKDKTLTINLTEYGLKQTIQKTITATEQPRLGRVIEQHRELYQLITATGQRQAQVTGKLAHQATSATAFPAVGDWVLFSAGDDDTTLIDRILPRQSVLARGAVNQHDGQIIATNIDTIFICMSLNADFNVRRVERYLTIAWDSGAMPVLVLTKADVCTDRADKLRALADVTVGVPTVMCSAETGEGLEDLQPYLTAGQTVAFVGSSGVGKSTLINRLLGATVLATKTIRQDDDKGRHTTTSRQLLPLPSGACVIDTPGMRELQIFVGDLQQTFAEITALAADCKFNDCTHTSEPGCAVQAAVADGRVSLERLQSYQKLQREMSYQGLNSRQLEQAKIQRMFGGKQAMKRVKQRYHRD